MKQLLCECNVALTRLELMPIDGTDISGIYAVYPRICLAFELKLRFFESIGLTDQQDI